jgi:serine/threonine-protein kinase
MGFRESNQKEWQKVQTKLFPISIPERAIWENIKDIIKVLKLVCTPEDLNHMFLPAGGGQDLEAVRMSEEKGCIELDLGSPNIVKPKRLIFESFDFNPEWNYFRLESSELQAYDLWESPKTKTSEKQGVPEVISDLSRAHDKKYELVEYRYPNYVGY